MVRTVSPVLGLFKRRTIVLKSSTIHPRQTDPRPGLVSFPLLQASPEVAPASPTRNSLPASLVVSAAAVRHRRLHDTRGARDPGCPRQYGGQGRVSGGPH